MRATADDVLGLEQPVSVRPGSDPVSDSWPSRQRRGNRALEWLVWGWRRLTAMRTAVVLLILLALTAIPGSLLPQRGVASDPVAVPAFFQQHPDLAPWLDRLWLFDVYAAPWFAAIYVLLLVSMTGCVIPRCRTLWRQARTAPPPAPRRLDRETHHRVVEVPDADAALDRAEAHLRARRHVVRRDSTEVGAERGRVREIGNLAFHLSLLVLLVGVAGGKLFGYEGRVALTEGQTFSNVTASYDSITPAPWADLNGLEPLSMTLERFSAEFETRGTKVGEPRLFNARVRYDSADEGSGVQDVEPNRPLEVNGTKFFLTGHGYAPELTVRDGNGDVVVSGPTVFLPADPSFASDGVVKAPDARPQPLALEGVFLPTAVPGPDGAPVSAFPGAANPRVQLTGYTGDLGLNDGTAQSIYTLDRAGLTQLTGAGGAPWRISLGPGETASLPGGLGTVTFEGLSQFANFQVARDPGKEISLIAAILLLVGLTTSLAVSRRRTWVRRVDDRHVEVGARSLSRRPPPSEAVDALVRAICGPSASASSRTDTTDYTAKADSRVL